MTGPTSRLFSKTFLAVLAGQMNSVRLRRRLRQYAWDCALGTGTIDQFQREVIAECGCPFASFDSFYEKAEVRDHSIRLRS